MNYPHRLIEQARHLATRDHVGRPRQDHLRRAVSAAYYALFHFLIDQACRSMIGAGHEHRSMRAILGRAFEHGSMKRASAPFASGNLPGRLLPASGGAAVPSELREIAESFRQLQERRHEADYDMLREFDRREVLVMIDQAERAMQLWLVVAPTRIARLYLLALLVGERIRE